jgi:phosphoglycerate kinase
MSKQVQKADDVIGPGVETLVSALPNGSVLLLENVRFYKEEEKNDPEFAKKRASLADIYVNDAFGTAHRAHASTEVVNKFLKPSVAGFLLQKFFYFCVNIQISKCYILHEVMNKPIYLIPDLF